MVPNVDAHAFGWELVLDLYDCDPELIRSKDAIIRFAVELCDRIQMKRYGDPFVERFGLSKPHTAGYSLVQLIETSSIVMHFSELTNAAYLNIFSCRAFDPYVVQTFAKDFFCAERSVERFIERY